MCWVCVWTVRVVFVYEYSGESKFKVMFYKTNFRVSHTMWTFLKICNHNGNLIKGEKGRNIQQESLDRYDDDFFSAVTDMHDAHSHSDIEDASGPTTEVIFHSPEEDAHEGEDVVSKELAQNVRVLCWIMTGPQNHVSKVCLL